MLMVGKGSHFFNQEVYIRNANVYNSIFKRTLKPIQFEFFLTLFYSNQNNIWNLSVDMEETNRIKIDKDLTITLIINC